MVSDLERPLISLQHVDVKIAGNAILHDINWRLFTDQRWGFIGANGSGKSSLLALIAGNLWPTPGSGRRRYDFGSGEQRDALEAKRRITLVGPELHDRYSKWGWNFSALDVVLSGVFRTDIPRRQAQSSERIRARGILRRFNLLQLADRPFLELSRGEQRRVLIARGMAFDPLIMLLDEPASGLDTASRYDLYEMLEQLNQKTIIMTCAHAVTDLPSITTHVMELDAGRATRSGPIPEAARRPNEGVISAADPDRSELHDPENSNPHGADLRIDVSHADVWLRGRRVLHDVCWQLLAGQHWLIRGANGAGKSTFLRLLHGQLRPALGGQVRWPTLRDPRNVWKLRRQVAYVSPELQATYRFPSSVHQCVASGIDSSVGLTRPLSPEEQSRCTQLLSRFELKELTTRPLSTLSYGQFRRVLLARTLVNRPRILLLDEPFEGLDEASAALVRMQLDEIVAEETQLICVSHLAALEAPFTHTLIIERGRIVKEVERESSARAGDELRENSTNVQQRAINCRQG